MSANDPQPPQVTPPPEDQNDNDNNDDNNNNDDNDNENSSSRSSSRVIIPPNAPAGQIIFTQPPARSTSYYKIAPSNPITFGWNFTFLRITPTSLTVSATCQGGNMYPVGPDEDGLIPGSATEVVWDMYSYQQAHPNTPLPQAMCNLRIAGEGGFDARERPGMLKPDTGMAFALYTPQPYTPLSEGWKCTVCGSASSLASHPASISLLVTLMICFLSGFHLLRGTTRQ